MCWGYLNTYLVGNGKVWLQGVENGWWRKEQDWGSGLDCGILVLSTLLRDISFRWLYTEQDGKITVQGTNVRFIVDFIVNF